MWTVLTPRSCSLIFNLILLKSNWFPPLFDFLYLLLQINLPYLSVQFSFRIQPLHLEAKNFSLLSRCFVGKFNLVSLMLKWSISNSRMEDNQIPNLSSLLYRVPQLFHLRLALMRAEDMCETKGDQRTYYRGVIITTFKEKEMKNYHHIYCLFP